LIRWQKEEVSKKERRGKTGNSILHGKNKAQRLSHDILVLQAARFESEKSSVISYHLVDDTYSGDFP